MGKKCSKAKDKTIHEPIIPTPTPSPPMSQSAPPEEPPVKQQTPVRSPAPSSSTESQISLYTYTGSQRKTMRTRGTADLTYSLKNRDQVLVLAYQGELSEIEQHLDKGFPIDFQLNESGWTLLHVAADTGNASLIEMLLDSGAYVDIQDKDQRWTPIMVAAMCRHLEIVALLRQRGADLLLRDAQGKTALDIAVQYNALKVAEFLSYVMQLATVFNIDFTPNHATFHSFPFYFIHHIQAFQHLSKGHMHSIQSRRGARSYEKFRTAQFRAGHGQDPGTPVLDFIALIRKKVSSYTDIAFAIIEHNIA